MSQKSEQIGEHVGERGPRTDVERRVAEVSEGDSGDMCHREWFSQSLFDIAENMNREAVTRERRQREGAVKLKRQSQAAQEAHMSAKDTETS